MYDILTEIFKGIVSVVLYFWWLFALLMFLVAWQNRRKTKWVSAVEHVVMEIKIPKTNDKNPEAAEMMFATLHGILKPKTELMKRGELQDHISFEIVSDITAIRFYVWTPKHLKDFVEGQIYAQYPSAVIKEVEDYTKRIDPKNKEIHVTSAEISLTKDDFLPIKTFNNFQVDPLAGITGVLSKLDESGEEIWIQILTRPVSDEWKRRGQNWAAKKKGGQTSGVGFSESFGKWLIEAPFKFLTDLIKELFTTIDSNGSQPAKLSAETESRISALEEKSEKLAYKVKIRAIYLSPTQEKSGERMQAIFGAFKQFNTTNLNGFKGHHIANDRSYLKDYENRLFINGGFHLNIEELASIYHLPHTSVETPNIKWTTARVGEPPTSLPVIGNTPEEDLAVFAKTNFRSHSEVFGIKRDDRRRHVYIIGKSGMGKTKLLENLINNDIKRGEGVALMDPHGDYYSDVINKIPEERIKDVVLFDPSDVGNPIAFNPMEVFDPNFKNQIASGVVGTFKKIFGDSWGPRLEYILNYTVLALLDTPDTTLLGIVRVLTDKTYRKKIVDNIQDPVVKKFWTTEFASYNEKFATEAIAPILNKVGQFVANSLIRNVVGQPKSSFNLRQLMDEKKIILINLSTGKVGETNAALLGSLMITAIQLAAMSRADVSEEERPDFYLYVDEFQNFATESFKTILSEARKYRLNLIMANQYISQMEDTGVKDAIFGNVGTIITFRVGAQDANELVKEFTPPFEATDLINLARQNIYIRMTIDGQSETAFSGITLTVSPETTGNFDKIIEHSRKLYTRPREEVEAEVAAKSGIEITANPSTAPGMDDASVDIVTADTKITATEEGDVFEAPIVKKIGKKGKHRSDTSSDLANIIKENIAHTEMPPNKEPETETTKIISGNKELSSNMEKVSVPNEKPMRIKDKIDKETLSEILKSVVTPSEEAKNNKKEAQEKIHEKKLDKDGGESKKSSSVRNKDLKNNGSIPPNKAVPSPTSKKEKIITAENFKDVKTIHPHEVVKIVDKSDDPQKVNEGDIIKFN